MEDKEIGWHKKIQGVSYCVLTTAFVTGYTADERLPCDKVVLLRDIIKGTLCDTQFNYFGMGQMVSCWKGRDE